LTKFISCVLAVVLLAMILFGLSWQIGSTESRQCKASGGLWFDNTNVCIAADCYVSKTCGVRAGPALNCKDLRFGDSIGRTYFLLGQPQSVDGNKHVWHTSKGSSDAFSVEIADGRIVSLACPA
jgi:hypothetical protein